MHCSVLFHISSALLQSAKKQLLTGVIFLNMPPQRSCLSLATFTFFSIVRFKTALPSPYSRIQITVRRASLSIRFLFSLDICSVRQQSQRGLNRGALSSSCWQNIVVDLTHLTSHILLLRHRHNCQSSTCHLNVSFLPSPSLSAVYCKKEEKAQKTDNPINAQGLAILHN